MKIRGRLLLSFLACSLLPMALLTGMNYWNARSASERISQGSIEGLHESADSRLVAICGIKKSEITSYFNTISNQMASFAEDPSVVDALRDFGAGFAKYRDEISNERTLNGPEEFSIKKIRAELRSYYGNAFTREYEKQNPNLQASATNKIDLLNDDAVALQHAYIVANDNPIGNKQKLDTADTVTSYGNTHAKYHPILRNFLDRFAFYDIFLVDSKTGNVVYTVFKELDFGTNLLNGPYASSNIGDLFRKANNSNNRGEVFLADFANYYPSYEAPASFIASPIFDGDQKVGVAIFQMPVDRINAIMGSRVGMGETGESYLVGSDFLPRSNSILDPERRSIVNAFRNPKAGEIRTEVVQRALKGEEGDFAGTNYLGQETLSAYAPIELFGLKWAIVTEANKSEVLKAAESVAEVSSAAQASNLFWSIIMALWSAALPSASLWCLSEASSIRSKPPFVPSRTSPKGKGISRDDWMKFATTN